MPGNLPKRHSRECIMDREDFQQFLPLPPPPKRSQEFVELGPEILFW